MGGSVGCFEVAQYPDGRRRFRRSPRGLRGVVHLTLALQGPGAVSARELLGREAPVDAVQHGEDAAGRRRRALHFMVHDVLTEVRRASNVGHTTRGVGGVGSVPGTVQPGFNPSGVASASVPVARPTPPAARSLHAPTDVAGGVRARPLARGPVSVSRAVGAREVDELLTRCDAREGDLRQRRDGRK